MPTITHCNRGETWRISLSREHSGRTNDIDTIEHATFRYGTVKVENGLNLLLMSVYIELLRIIMIEQTN